MHLTSFYPVVCTHGLTASVEFYTRWFGFERTFETDWYVSLRHPAPPHYELALLDPDHPSMPTGYRRPAAGLLLNVEVSDVDSEYRRLVREAGLRPVLDLRTEPWGQRHFIIADPAGVLLDVITPTPPTAEYGQAYTDVPPAP